MLIGAALDQHHPTIDVVASLRFELFYGLYTVLRDDRVWTPTADLTAVHRRLGAWPEVWLGIGDVLGDVAVTAGYDTLIDRLGQVPRDELTRTLLFGMLHDLSLVEEMMAGRMTPAAAIAALPATKRQWLVHVGLYPIDHQKPAGQFIDSLLDDPDEVRETILTALDIFWRDWFANFWRERETSYQAAAHDMTRDLGAGDLATAIMLNRLPVEIDEASGELCALRGGARSSIEAISTVYLMPSAFNAGRFWNMLDSDDGEVAYFPIHRPSLLGLPAMSDTPSEVDLALVCRALGNSSRVAIADLLAERPRSASEIAETLGLSKSTVSHHLFLMREAGLIDEEMTPSRSVILTLRRGAFFALPDAAMRRFFSREDH